MTVERALLLTDGLLDKLECKTAHGLILGTCRYTIVGVIDGIHYGQDAGLVIRNKKIDIPIFATIKEAMVQLKEKPNICVVGVAPMGGKFSRTLVETILDGIDANLSIVNGLHDLLEQNELIRSLAIKQKVNLVDIRKPKLPSQLKAWTGDIADIKTPRIAVLGTDCAVGKRTTAGLLLHLCKKNGIKAEMIYTGQTGWLEGLSYGFILDSTLNDFVSGKWSKQYLNATKKSIQI